MEINNLKLLFPTAGLCCGIIGGEFTSSFLLTGSLCLGFSIMFWLILHIISRKPQSAITINRLHSIWIFFLFAGLGIFDLFLTSPKINIDSINGKYCQVTGEILQSRALADGDRLKLKINSLLDEKGANLDPSNLIVMVKTDGYNGGVGDIISFKSRLFSIDQFNSQNASYVTNMKHQGINLFTSVNSNYIRETGKKRSLGNWFDQLREDLEILIEKSSLNRETGDFLISVLLGNKYFLATTSRETLTSAGMAHILALSGMHLAILISILSIVLLPLDLFKRRKIKYFALLSMIWFFVFLTGAAPSTTRAAVMATFMIIAILLERKNTALNSLLAAVMVILIFDPKSLWNIGFQLSIFCVVSILIFSERLNRVDRHKHPLTHKLISSLLITITTTMTTWVLVAYYFKNIPLMFLPANLLLLPFLPLFIGAGLFFMILLYFGIDFRPLSYFLDLFHDNFMGLSEYFSIDGKGNLPLQINELSVIIWIGAMIFAGIALYSVKRKKKITCLAISFLLIGLCFVNISFYKEENSVSIVFPHSFTTMAAKIYTPEGIKKLTFKRGMVSKGIYDGNEILAIDCKLKENSKQDWFEKKGETKKRFLIIGGEADFDDIVSEPYLYELEKIILHSTIGKKKKQEFLEKIPAELHSIVYSSRENGSLEVKI